MEIEQNLNVGAKKRANLIGWGLVSIALLGQLVSGILVTFMPKIFATSIGTILASYIGMYGIGLPILLLLVHKIPRTKLVKRNTFGIGKMIAAYVLMLSGMYIINLLYTGLMQLLSGKSGNVIGEAMADFSILQMFLLTVILAPILEEFIFRKLLYHLLSPYGSKIYIITSALLFALMHLNLGQGLYAFWIGLILAWILYRTGNIFYTILLHMLLNFTGSIVPTLLGDHPAGVAILGIWVIVILVAGIVLFILTILKSKKQGTPFFQREGQTTSFKPIILNGGMLTYIIICSLIMLFIFITQILVPTF